MEDLSELFQPIIDFVLGNIGIVIFILFLLSGFLGRGNKKDAQQETDQQQRRQQASGEQDNRPLAERLAEAFGVEIPEEQRQSRPQQQARPQTYASDTREGRRSTSRRSVQEDYPELFGGSSIFEESAEEETRWGFDETEWGTTFERNEEQWRSSFPDKRSSEPRIDVPR